MAPRVTKADLEERTRRAERERNAAEMGLSFLGSGEAPDATETFTDEEGDRHVYRLFGARRAEGGYVVITYFHEGQRPATRCQLLDEAVRNVAGLYDDQSLPHRIALERLTRARNAALNGDGAEIQIGSRVRTVTVTGVPTAYDRIGTVLAFTRYDPGLPMDYARVLWDGGVQDTIALESIARL